MDTACKCELLNQKFATYIQDAKHIYEQTHNGKPMPQSLNYVIGTTLEDISQWYRFDDYDMCKLRIRMICHIVSGMVSTELLPICHGSIVTHMIKYAEYSEGGESTFKRTHLQTYNVTMGEIPYTLPKQYTSKSQYNTAYFQGQTAHGSTHITETMRNKLDAFIISKILDACEVCGESWSINAPDAEPFPEYFQTFKSTLEQNIKIFYHQLNVAVPTYIVIPIPMIKVLRTLDGFTEAQTHDDYGFFCLGTLDSLDIYVAPIIEDGSYLLGACCGGCVPGAVIFSELFYDLDKAIHGESVDVDKFSCTLGVDIFNPKLLMRCKVIGAEYSGELS